MHVRYNTPFTRNGQEFFEAIINIWPPIIRDRKREKIQLMLALLMRARSAAAADKNLVIEAARMVVPKSYDPLFHMLEDRDTFTRTLLDPFRDMQAYDRIPVKVRRWKRTRRSTRRTRAANKSIIAFCASPRKNGNTDLLIEEALRGARDAGAQTEKIMLHNASLGYCIGCRKCKEPGFKKI